MKTLNEIEMRTVNGGKTYTFKCSCGITLKNLSWGQYITAKFTHGVGLH